MDNIKKIENVVESIEQFNAAAVEAHDDSKGLAGLDLKVPVYMDRDTGMVLVLNAATFNYEGSGHLLDWEYCIWDEEQDRAQTVMSYNLPAYDDYLIYPEVASVTFDDGGFTDMEADSAEDFLHKVRALAFASLSRIMLVERAMSIPVDTLIEAYNEQMKRAGQE